MVAVAYIPVLHAGYVKFLREHASEGLWLIGDELTEGFKPIRKEIRALATTEMATAIRSFGICDFVEVLTVDGAQSLRGQICLPDEDISRQVAGEFLQGCRVHFEKVFLRWDKHRTLGEVEVSPDRVVSRDVADRELILQALREGEKSSDWWRHVGAVLTRHGEVILAAGNRHVPSDHTPYTDGDPRNNFSRGQHLELSTAMHAEARIIAEAAKLGIHVDGAFLYVTTFPCPPCAKLIAYSGISRLYYAAGYGVLDGESILRSQGVEIILVDMENPPTS